MDAEHTPGPWIGMNESGKYNGNHSWNAEDEDACVSEFAPIFAGRKVVALVVHSSPNFYAGSSKKLDSNARLIAAAPELLATLETCRSFLYVEYGACQMVTDIDAIIAKAKGQA